MTELDPPDQALAATIRRLREERGATQEDMAFGSGLSMTAYVRTERGTTSPAWTTVKRIAKALGMTPSELVAVAEGAER